MKFMENINVNIKNANLDMEVLEVVEAPGWAFWVAIGAGTVVGAAVGAIIVT